MKNNFQKYKEILEVVKKQETKPKLLFHVCCAPCFAYPILELSKYFDVTVYYSNSNIYPYDEYVKRKNEVDKYINKINSNIKNNKVKKIYPKYNYQEFRKDIIKYKDAPEGGIRCTICFKKRLRDLVGYAEKNSFDYVTTSMTISRMKNEKVLNNILENEAKKVDVLFSNFKKEKGLEISQKISKKENFYRQKYCGCEFSLHDVSRETLKD